jgi:peptidyl-prolyl cis-trans isomerase D
VVAVLTAKNEKGYANINDIKEELTAAVRNEEKGKQIVAKLKGVNGNTLEDIAAKYGPTATVRTASDVTFASGNIEGLGVDPVAVGKAFGLKAGKRSAPFEGQSGVVMLEVTGTTKTPATQDVIAVRKDLEANRSGRSEGNAYQFVRDQSKIKDERVKFF